MYKAILAGYEMFSGAVQPVQPVQPVQAVQAVQPVETQALVVDMAHAEEILRTLPPLPQGSLPYFTEEQQPIIVRYINAHLTYLQTDPLNSQKQRLLAARRAIQQEFNDIQALIALDAEEIPEIFNVIHARNTAKANELKIAFITSIFPGTPLPELRALSDLELTRKNGDCITLKREIDTVNTKLHFLTHEKAKLQSPVVIGVDHLPARSRNPAESQFRITASSLTVGYSIHNMLLVNNIFSDGRAARPAYAGATTFDLSRAEFASLNRYLTELQTWYRDFDMILSCLFGENAERFTRTGQKPLSEIIKTEMERKIKGLPLFIEPAVTAQLKRISQDTVVLLIGQVGLDLTAHVDKDELKALLEMMYRTHKLTDSKGDQKTFIIDRGFQYTSLLSINNIDAIFTDLMAHASLATIARGMGFNSGVSPDFLSCFETTEPSIVYHRFLLEKLSELPIGALNARKTAIELDVGHKRDIRARAMRMLPVPQGLEQVKNIQEGYERQIPMMLDSLSGVLLKPMAAGPDTPEPTDEALSALLPRVRRDRSALYPITIEDVQSLFVHLKGCEAYQAAIEPFEDKRRELHAEGRMVGSLDESLDQLNRLFTQRIQKFDRAGADLQSNQYYGRGPFLLALKSLMGFVSKVVYQETTGIAQASINKACISLCDILEGRDMEDGCEKGFSGRIVELHTTLTKSADDVLVAADLNLRKDIADRLFIQHVAIGSESSMAYVFKQSLYVKLGLAASSLDQSPIPVDKEQAFLSAFAAAYTPSAIYAACYATIIDNLKAYLRDDEEEKIYELLQSLGFTSNIEGELSEIDRTKLNHEFRLNAAMDVGSAWNLSKINLGLPEAIIRTLILKETLTVSCVGQLVLQQDARGILVQRFNRESAPVARAPAAFFPAAARPAVVVPAAAARPLAPAPDAQRYGVFARPAAQPTAGQVRAVAQSELAKKPDNTSIG